MSKRNYPSIDKVIQELKQLNKEYPHARIVEWIRMIIEINGVETVSWKPIIDNGTDGIVFTDLAEAQKALMLMKGNEKPFTSATLQNGDRLEITYTVTRRRQRK